MRFNKAIVLFVSCLIPTLILAQQSAPPSNDEEVRSHDVSNENGIFVALLNLLSERNGVIVYDDLNRELLRHFDCHDEYNRTSIGTSGKEKGISDSGVKSHCERGAVVQYAGRSHSTDGDYFSYMLNIVWNVTRDQCFHAETALKTLRNHGWIAQSMFGAPSVQSQFLETYPNTERFTLKNNGKAISVTWVSRENPNSLQNVNPSTGCLRLVLLGN